MDFMYKGKLIFPTKTALDELSDLDLDLYQVIDILEHGFAIRKRKKNVIEKGMAKSRKVVNVVVVDMGNYYELIHAGQFTLSRKFKKLRDKHGV